MEKKFIKKRIDVEQPDKSETYTHVERGEPDGANLPRTIFFIGLRCSGKTTVARKVAATLDLRFVDTDALVEKDIASDIATFVADNGWEAFRQAEHEVLKTVCDGADQVVACGGGIVLREDNRTLLRRHGTVFYLMADVGTLKARIESDPQHGQRPSLTGKSISEELGETLVEREPLYMSIANHVLQAHKPLDALVDDVLVALGRKDIADSSGLLDDF